MNFFFLAFCFRTFLQFIGLTLFFKAAEFLNMFHDIFEALKSVIGSAMHLDGTKVKH